MYGWREALLGLSYGVYFEQFMLLSNIHSKKRWGIYFSLDFYWWFLIGYFRCKKRLIKKLISFSIGDF